MVRAGIFILLGSLALIWMGGYDAALSQTQPTEKAASGVTNRLHVPAEVVDNLGLTFAEVTRGRLGNWIEVPGTLQVPDDQRFTMGALGDSYAFNFRF
ncbi:hypothetical protein [Candidatus Entotheonella palauensis]|uniref:hypothetical protein n=1 Tax=Candidatus Entotheonella palauensis TaxID=93172 RepID=UPI000B7F637B|nr:hypothetical protein [Candidatus Entotheonella palauensis]